MCIRDRLLHISASAERLPTNVLQALHAFAAVCSGLPRSLPRGAAASGAFWGGRGGGSLSGEAAQQTAANCCKLL
eukprot:13528212-Alexandrium_andersonii.AAC.1